MYCLTASSSLLNNCTKSFFSLSGLLIENKSFEINDSNILSLCSPAGLFVRRHLKACNNIAF